MNSRDEKPALSAERFNNATLQFPKDKTLISLFSDQVKTVPFNLALRYRNNALTYSELDTITTQFANYIIDLHKVQKGDFVGIMLERSEWHIISILAILKAGAAYVPIDIESPQSRRDYIVTDSQCTITIDAALIDAFSSENEKNNAALEIQTKPKDLAYIIYTSGTTGHPKGVMIENRSAVNLIMALTKHYNIQKTERILQFSNYFFDASVVEIFLALLNGAALVIIDKAVLKNHLLSDFIKENHITHLEGTPSYLDTITDLAPLKTLKRIIAGGEPCSLKLAQKLGAFCDFYNAYGPTENTVASTVYQYAIDNEVIDVLPIGKPIYNIKAYILSDALELLPIGVVGELCLSGSGLAKGYLNLPELTAEKFVGNPFSKEERLYKTGDLAKRLPDGNIKFIGRKGPDSLPLESGPFFAIHLYE